MKTNVLLIEPYYAGSHKQLIDLLHSELECLGESSEGQGTVTDNRTVSVQLATMTGKKWHWRARTSALYFSQNLPRTNFDVIFTSCVSPLHELIALRPDLSSSKKIIYFHENQLTYPVRKSKDRDFQYGYNQVLSCLVADIVLFNSKYNMESFQSNLSHFFKLQPDFRPKNLREQIEPKCRVLYFPLCFDRIDILKEANAKLQQSSDDSVIRIVWPHRWEFDKNPGLFFRVIYKLLEEGVSNFRLSILGETFKDNPVEFTEAKVKLQNHLDHFGFLPDKSDYYKVLGQSDIVVSTADHEFFGVAMLEAVYSGCFPFCPNKLVYPEIFPFKPCLYESEDDLCSKLKTYLTSSLESRQKIRSVLKMNYDMYNWNNLKNEYLDVLAAPRLC